MVTFHVQPDGYLGLRVYSPRLGHTITFVDGAYESSDPAEIRVLRRNRYCFDVGELERDLTAMDPPDAADQEAVDAELAKLKADAPDFADRKAADAKRQAEIDDENAELAARRAELDDE